MENNSARSGGIGFFGLLTILFIGLKLAGFIDWSWFWILSPLIFSAGLYAIVLVILLVIVFFK